ncbi:hypothetical protein Tco_1370259, partial [Tanacetum coccineum]
MSTPPTSVMSRTRHLISYIVLSDSEDEDTTTFDVSTPLSPDHMPDSFGYSPDSDIDSEPTKDDSSNEDLTETAELRPDRPLMMRTLRKRVRTPDVLPSAIEATIADEIDEPPLKRARLSSPSSPPLSPLPSSSRKRSRSPLPPLPLLLSLPSVILPPRSGYQQKDRKPSQNDKTE